MIVSPTATIGSLTDFKTFKPGSFISVNVVLLVVVSVIGGSVSLTANVAVTSTKLTTVPPSRMLTSHHLLICDNQKSSTGISGTVKPIKGSNPGAGTRLCSHFLVQMLHPRK